MMIYGILFGLLAAFSQSVSYLLARKFSAGRTSARTRLLVASHVVLGVISATALPFLWPAGIEWSWLWIRPLIFCAVFYLIGQGLIFVALHAAEASKISPLLAIKVVFLSFLTWWMMGTQLSFLQWTGVALCLAGTFLLNCRGGGIAPLGIAGVLGACLFYSFSDINIPILVQALETETLTRWNAIFFGVCMTYILCGLICAPFMIFSKASKLADLKSTLPFAIVWLISIVLLFATFSIVGALYGNILQSTRGIISIILGAIIAKLGHHHIEGHVSRGVFIRRLIAGIIMTAAIAAFALG